jgi:predicted amidohydrolase
MPTPNIAFKIAAVQAGPVFLNREATVEKACKLISQAGRQDARLVVFPESFIPAYPDWVWAVPPGRGKILSQLYAELLANAVEIPQCRHRTAGPGSQRGRSLCSDGRHGTRHGGQRG